MQFIQIFTGFCRAALILSRQSMYGEGGVGGEKDGRGNRNGDINTLK